jgi:pyroglutamyl-peptidase
MAKTRVLVSGFESFTGVEDNPSGAVVRRMRQRADGGGELDFVVLPVTWSGAARVLLARADKAEVRGVLMFGVAAGDASLRVERCAWNLAAADVPDNAGVRKQGEALVPGGAERVDTAFPVGALIERLCGEGVPVRASEDPGRYICNALYHAVLTSGHGYAKDALFVHVPPTSEASGGVTLDALERWMGRVVEGFCALRREDY